MNIANIEPFGIAAANDWFAEYKTQDGDVFHRRICCWHLNESGEIQGMVVNEGTGIIPAKEYIQKLIGYVHKSDVKKMNI